MTDLFCIETGKQSAQILGLYVKPSLMGHGSCCYKKDSLAPL